jgi:hypothetical protein
VEEPLPEQDEIQAAGGEDRFAAAFPRMRTRTVISRSRAFI